MCFSEDFATLKGIRQPNEKMVEMKNDIVYSLVYSSITLSFIMPASQLQQLLLKESFYASRCIFIVLY
jgi:hypothetical protein